MSVTLSMEQLCAAKYSSAHIAALRAAGAVSRPHMYMLDVVPVGLARRALRYQRAFRRSLHMSGVSLTEWRRRKHEREQWRFDCERYGLVRTTTTTGRWKTTTFTEAPA